jgi:hypothetical protein
MRPYVVCVCTGKEIPIIQSVKERLGQDGSQSVQKREVLFEIREMIRQQLWNEIWIGHQRPVSAETQRPSSTTVA